MKKLFAFLATLSMLFAVGCNEQGVDDNPNEPIPENIFFGLDKETVSITPDGGSVDVIVYSNYKWEISGTSDWCTPSATSGKANEDGQKVSFSADVAYDNREATFWFRCADEKIKFTVSQSFKEVIIADENNTFSVPAEGGVAVLNYQTTVECEVIIPEEAKSWITMAPADATRGLMAESVQLDVAENATYSARSAVVKVVKVGDNTLFAEYTINQVQNDAFFADNNNTFNIKGWDQSIQIAYQTNMACDVIIPEEAKSWISIAPATRALVDESVTLNIAANNAGPERSAVVRVVAVNNSELLAEYTITQAKRYYIGYTSTDGSSVTPYSSDVFGATIIRNEYTDGKGYIDFDAPVTSIGNAAFYDCDSLASIIIPDSVTSIGNYAFAYCYSLTSINIPDSVTKIGEGAFRVCDSLTSINIPDRVTSIRDNAFSYCTSLTSITIPDRVTSIGDYAFNGCSSLTSITIPDSVTSIGWGSFFGCSSMASFQGKFASEDGRCLIIKGVLNFFAPAGLTEYTIPDSVTSIGYGAFANCSSLTSITIPDSVTSIGGYAFAHCYSLKNVTIPDSVTEIGWCAFDCCSSLTSITIPNSVIEIGEEAFYNCGGELIINSKIVEENYYSDTYPQIDGWLRGAIFTKLTIGDSVTSIGNYAFAYCDSLTSITIPDSVTSIGEEAFRGCTWLRSVTIGNGVTSIGEWAFAYCDSLTSITIPDSVTSIGEWAFAYCTSLESVYCKPTTPPMAYGRFGGYSWNAFYDNAWDRKIYVPRASVNAYQVAEGWMFYGEEIEGYDF